MNTASTILAEVRSLADPARAAGMASFGISDRRLLGVSMPALRAIGKRHRNDHALAAALWKSGIHEARILASIVDDPITVTPDQMETWVTAFDSWDLCDQCCLNLFRKTPHAWEKAIEWSARDEEFVKRAGFTLMAVLAVHDKSAGDVRFRALLPIVARESRDARNFVKKAVNWALRQIGKRNAALRADAIRTAEAIAKLDSPAARWIAKDALRELDR
jgi:3-methyladenine DNA glycosylase AlkD